MTNPVTQGDRDRAADYLGKAHPMLWSAPRRIAMREFGEHDSNPLVQAFAAHRIAAEQASEKEIAELKHDLARCMSRNTELLNGDADGWQDIATAPRDGTLVDLWNGERYTDCRFNAVASRWEHWGLGGFDTMGWCRVEKPPTHWRPLPELPARSTPGASER